MCGVYSEEWDTLIDASSWEDFIYHPLRGISGPTRWRYLRDMREEPLNMDLVLSHTILCDASDLRDKVYGLRKSLSNGGLSSHENGFDRSRDRRPFI